MRLSTIMKKDVLYVLVRTNSMDEWSQFFYSFLVPPVMCSEVEARNFTTLVYSILLNVGKCAEKSRLCGKIASEFQKIYLTST
jgi:hypothetical protein